jgi:hypothetical protein
MELKGLVPCSLHCVTKPYPDPGESNVNKPIPACPIKIPFEIILQCTPLVSQLVSSSQALRLKLGFS